MHNVSDRDYQLARTQWTIDKTFDNFGPKGPSLVSKDGIGARNDLRIWFDLNGEILQASNTNQMVIDVPALLDYFSTVKTQNPGDIVCTGTPLGDWNITSHLYNLPVPLGTALEGNWNEELVHRLLRHL